MHSKLIVGYDGSEHARDALAFAKRLGAALNRDLVLANVYPGRPRLIPGKADVDGFFNILERDAGQVLGDAPADAGSERRTVGASSPARGLNDLADEIDAAIIVVGSAHRGMLGHVEAGHTAQHLLHGAPCAVAVAPAGYAAAETKPHRRVAVGVNGTPEAGVALDAAVEMARTLEATLRIVAVADPVWSGAPLYAPPVDVARLMRETAQEDLAAAAAATPDDVAVEQVLLEGDATALLADQGDCDLVVVGSRGYGRVKGVLLGSVSSKVVRGGKTPVLVVPREANVPVAAASIPGAAPVAG